MQIDLKWAINLSVVAGKEDIAWWPYETDRDWWTLRLWTRRN